MLSGIQQTSNQTTNTTTNQNTNQIFNPNNNNAFTISFGGSSGGSDLSSTAKDVSTDFGTFAPINDNTTENKQSTDVGASLGLGFGGSGSGGTVAMSRSEEELPQQSYVPSSYNFGGNTASGFDGYSSDIGNLFDDKNTLLGVGVVVLLGVGTYLFTQRNKKKK